MSRLKPKFCLALKLLGDKPDTSLGYTPEGFCEGLVEAADKIGIEVSCLAFGMHFFALPGDNAEDLIRSYKSGGLYGGVLVNSRHGKELAEKAKSND